MTGGAMIGGMGPFGALIMLMILGLSVVAYWRIFAKAGYSGAWALLAFLPPVQIFLLLFLAFAAWPRQKAKEFV